MGYGIKKMFATKIGCIGHPIKKKDTHTKKKRTQEKKQKQRQGVANGIL